ncbi:hypothetical protein F3Y22_tig00111022pilonHSYRG00184 [Hibiscus syriacus]|uniref:Uncharacterized protein n=1 Tax=Hibiscus syriacus TaxID=106335 RepID=A0A6A2Z7T3_HIBSY|nr:hypothetical protein F3Y22_tig00111022pilonHSYRG00184 [Hibiscus syriacus]
MEVEEVAEEPWEESSSEWSKEDVQNRQEEQVGVQELSEPQNRIECWIRSSQQGKNTTTEGGLNLNIGMEDNFVLCKNVTEVGDVSIQQEKSEDVNEGRENGKSLGGVPIEHEKVDCGNGLIRGLDLHLRSGLDQEEERLSKGCCFETAKIMLHITKLQCRQGTSSEYEYRNEEGDGAEALESWNMTSWNLLSWNVRGLGRRIKARAVRRVVKERKPVILFIQESKMEVLTPLVVRKMGGNLLTASAAGGSVGGLITLWNEKECKIIEEIIHRRFVVVKGIIDGLQGSCWFINVYGPSVDSEKEAFFGELLSFLENIDCPVCLGGDFNVVMSQDEKMGGAVNLVTMFAFKDFMSKANLLDLPLVGGRFTWCNNRDIPTYEKLDRFLVDQRFLSLYPMITQRLLERSVSDHNSILLENRGWNWGPKPFKLFNYVLEEDGFCRMMEGELVKLCNVENRQPIYSVLKGVQDAVKNWSGKGYLEILGRINRLEKEIQEMELNLQQGLSMVSMKNLVEAKKELWDLYKKDELIWLQKSRLKWSLNGDKNTRNGIKSIKVDNENISDPKLIKASVVHFFNGLFNQENTLEVEEMDLDFLQLSNQQSMALEKPFSEEEIWGIFMRERNGTWKPIIFHSKRDNPGLEDFRPISLVGGFYKILSKVLARRLSLCINEVISPSQFAFIPGRHILDCSFIANEGIDCWRKKGLKGVVFKVDFKRAFDIVDWRILLKIMSKMGFGARWSSWMYKCVSAASISVLVNGTPTEKIHITRGLRIFGINVGEEEPVSWAKEIGCIRGVFPSEYLGLPLGAKRNSFYLWEPVIQKFYNNLAGWKAKSLSLAGRVVLVKSVLCSIPIHYLSIFRIPISVLNKLNSIMASFLWGRSSDKKNIHWIKWDLVCKPKKLGGLGIPNLLLLNRALMGKWVWKFAGEKNSWWKSVVCCVYNMDPNSLMIRNTWTARSSWIWRGIVKNFFSSDAFRDCFRRNLCVRAGNGETVQFWHDVWLGSAPLKDRFPRLFALSNNKEGKVAEFRLHNDSGWVWDIQMRRNLVDWEVEQWLVIISLLNSSSLSLVEEDCWIWLGNGEGCFTAKSCMKTYFDREGIDQLESNWEQYVWKGVAPPRVESFVWQLAHHRVAVKEELLKRGVSGVEDSVCPLCRKYNETVSHLFLHYEVVWVLWAKFLKFWNVFFVVPGSVMDFLIAWDDLVPRSNIWKFISRAVLWSIWKCRNEVIFQNRKVDSALLFFISRFRTVSWFETSVKDVHFHFDSLMGDLKLADQHVNLNKRYLPSSRWSPLPIGFLKVNVDGAMVKGWDKGGIGGLTRDGRGMVLGSFSEKVGGGPPLLAELLAIKRGLILIEEVEADLFSNQRIILESDSSNALKWINNPNLNTTLFHSLVRDIASTVERKGIITRLISRAANWEADELAKAAETRDGYSILIELSDVDPFFDKKKRLLNDRGFDIKEIVLIKNSLDSGSLHSTLNQMLQIARIIHLDEVELYFGPVGGMGFYSPRNEMEAQSCILSLIESSLSSQVHMQAHALQDLRDAIISRIHELGTEDKVENKIDINYKCDKENSLIQWAENNGAKTRLQITYIEGAGRGAIATEDLEVGDIAMEIPASIIISEDLVYKSDMYPVLGSIDGMSSETMSLLWSMKERHNCHSQFKIYFDTLPENFNTGLSFGVEAIMALDGTLLFEEIMQAKEVLYQASHFLY